MMSLSMLLLLFLFAHLSSAKIRTYYVATVDVLWDYAPSDVNQINSKPLNNDPDAAVFTKKSPIRIGKVYKKTVYREYTDSTFTKQKERDNSMGILGPVLRGQHGDIIHIFFKNLARRSYTMHPHTVFYTKSSEGALYSDSSFGNTKADDGVTPGSIQQYFWIVTKEGTPAEGDPNCLTWLYHSHIKPTLDMNSGPVGMIETCKSGIMNDDGTRNDVQKEFYLLFYVLDENKSWFLDENLQSNGIKPSEINKEDEDFKESNLMHAINGRIYGNLDGFDVCQGDKVAWHMSVLGGEVDMHTISFDGNTVISDHHRTDMLGLFPAHSGTVLMQADNSGKWTIRCKVADHEKAGMLMSYSVNATCSNQSSVPFRLDGKLRRYFIAAEEVVWNYGPSGYNSFNGEPLTQTGSSSATFFVRGPNRIGGSYLKARYIEYTDDSFLTKKMRSVEEEKHLGFLGPVIKAEVGDTIQVVFKNKLSFNASIHPRGVWYNKSNEGAYYSDATDVHLDGSVPPNGTYIYEWLVPDEVAPTQQDTPCIAWLYASDTDPVKDTYSGLIGPLVTCKRNALKPNGIPKGYAAEKYLFPAVMDENESWYLEKNMEKYCLSPKCANISKDDEDFKESNKMHQINGFMFGDLGIEMCKGEKVIFYGFGIGSEIDLHSIYFAGNGLEIDGNHKDSLMIFPGGSITFSMTPDNTGTWALLCDVNDHYQTGMRYTYKVNKCTSKDDAVKSVASKIRTYYIGIVETDWDYAPNNMQLTSGVDFYNDSNAKTFTERTASRIGKVYKKARYVEYLDATFTKAVPVTERTQHLGLLGPFIFGEEGDEIVVLAKNMASRNYSINPHGLLFSKDNEGAKYQDATKHKGGAIPPGETYTYRWFVPKRASPGPNDGPCLTWAYFSSVDPVKDTNSGLIGPLIICREGTLIDGRRKDIDKEFALLFSVMDENESWYLDDNIKKYTLAPDTVDKTNSEFKDSNKMNAINGYIYSNGPNNGGQFKMQLGDRVAWYVMGFGNEIDIHTVHFHGNSFYHRTNSKHVDDVYDIFPGIFATLEMVPVNPGKWLLHCHVNDHKQGGMETIFEVQTRMVWGSSPACSIKTSKTITILILIISIFILLW